MRLKLKMAAWIIRLGVKVAGKGMSLRVEGPREQEEWRTGDLIECVRSSPFHREGERFTVLEVDEKYVTHTGRSHRADRRNRYVNLTAEAEADR